MPIKGKRDLAKEKFWRKALERYAASGKSRAQFCADENLAVHAFYYWSDKILERDAERTRHNATQPAPFVPVVTHQQSQLLESGTKQPVAELVFAGGSIFLFNGIHSSTLRELFRALRDSLK